MKIINTTILDTEKLKTLFANVARLSAVNIENVLIQVKPGRKARRRITYGSCFSGCIGQKHKGRWIDCEAMIILYTFKHRKLADMAHTFAHELSHLRDYMGHWVRRPGGFVETRTRRYGHYLVVSKIPALRERRANAFADLCMETILLAPQPSPDHH